jgi:DMSO/TMAO reductase YedYZ molybdopterin-dependent catalytic subunit
MRANRHLAPLLTALLLAACAARTGAPGATPPGPRITPTATTQLTPIDQLGKTGSPVRLDIGTYRLVVDGLVERPLSLSYDELLALPAVTQVPRLECPGFFVDIAQWTGPSVRSLLEQAGVKPGANQVDFYDGHPQPYQKALTLEEALADDTYLAYKVNGETLPVEHGYPLRLVAGSKLGSYWVKWLVRIELKEGPATSDVQSPLVADFPRANAPS